MGNDFIKIIEAHKRRICELEKQVEELSLKGACMITRQDVIKEKMNEIKATFGDCDWLRAVVNHRAVAMIEWMIRELDKKHS